MKPMILIFFLLPHCHKTEDSEANWWQQPKIQIDMDTLEKKNIPILIEAALDAMETPSGFRKPLQALKDWQLGKKGSWSVGARVFLRNTYSSEEMQGKMNIAVLSKNGRLYMREKVTLYKNRRDHATFLDTDERLIDGLRFSYATFTDSNRDDEFILGHGSDYDMEETYVTIDTEKENAGTLYADCKSDCQSPRSL